MYQELKDLIAKSENIVFLGGAGVSTESGIPDFRSSRGRYTTAAAQGDVSPEEAASFQYMLRNSEAFFGRYRTSLDRTEAKPNRAHYALAKLEQMGKLRAVVTQNVDGLHQEAGSVNVHELHGSNRSCYCQECELVYPVTYMRDPSNCYDNEGNPGFTPRCEACHGIVRPGVVLFGEQLNNAVMSAAYEAVSLADLLIVGGTSLVVHPAASLVDCTKRGATLVILNQSETPYDHKARLIIRDPIGQVLGTVMDV